MVLSICGGSPGERNELDPGNGSTATNISEIAKATAADAAEAAAEGRVGDTSAQGNTHAAAEAALQVGRGLILSRDGGEEGNGALCIKRFCGLCVTSAMKSLP